MAGRASIVGAAVTHVGNVREHNEDAHFFDADLGLFVVCDGMGGHAAGEVASAIAIQTIRERWSDAETTEIADVWLDRGTAIAKKQLLGWLRDGVIAAHDAILAEAERDPTKGGMGTTVVAAMIVGGEAIFAHAGDSRAYMVRDQIAMQLTEDHTLLQRLMAAGIDVDVSGDGGRFRSMLTNALGIGNELKVSTFVVPLADGDRFMLCSDGISEYVTEAEVGEVLTSQPSPARAAQKLVEIALERGGADNATAVVVKVLEAGDSPVPSEQRRRDDLSLSLCELWSEKVSPQQRLRAMRIAIPREHQPGEVLPANTLGDRVAWIVIEGEVTQHGEPLGPGSLVYPESLVAGTPVVEKDALASARTEVRALAIRCDDFRELGEDDPELGEVLVERLTAILQERVRDARTRGKPSTSELQLERAIERAATAQQPAVLAPVPLGEVPAAIDEDPEVAEPVTPVGSVGPDGAGNGAHARPSSEADTVVALARTAPPADAAPTSKRLSSEYEIEVTYSDEPEGDAGEGGDGAGKDGPARAASDGAGSGPTHRRAKRSSELELGDDETL